MKFIDDKEVGSRLKQFREDMNISARKFAIGAGLDQSHYSKVERGELGITETMMDKLTIKYGLNKDWVLYGIGNSIPNSSVNESEEQSIANEPVAESYLSKRRKSKSAPSKPYMVPFIPVKAQAGYVRAVDQQVYMDTLEKYALPPGVNPHGNVWAYWEVEGDSMLPQFREGDIILTSYVHPMDWENIRNFYTYVIVTHDQASEMFRQRVLFKRLYCKNALEWVLISDNEELYPQQLIPVEYIKEVWVYRKTWSTRAEPPKMFEIKV